MRLLTDTELMRVPVAQALVQNVLPDGALAALVGPPGAGKTFLALTIATAVALPWSWMGHAVLAGGPVIYLAGEGLGGFPRRLRAVREGYGLPDDEPSGVLYVAEPLSLLRPDDVTTLLDSVRERLADEAPQLFVFDPLAAFMAGGDENSTRDMAAVVAALTRIRTDTGAGCLLLHHTGWNPERERGSTVLRGALDVLYAVKREDALLTVECVKMRDALPPGRLYLRLTPTADSCLVTTADATVTAATLTARQTQALEALRRIVVDEGVPYSRWKTVAALPETTFDESLAVLVRRGLVVKTGHGRGALYGPALFSNPGTPGDPGVTPAGGTGSNPGNPGGSLDPGVRGNGPGLAPGVLERGGHEPF